jgi:hypothetical protein
MMIDRRDFIAGVAVAAVAPTLPLLSDLPPALAAEARPLVLMINGWSVPDESAGADVAWITISHSWRTAWR